MSKTALIWVFKILGVLTLSVILWATFIGTGGTIATLTAVDTANNPTDVGPVYERVMFGNDDHGFKAYLQQEWCYNSNYNGYWLSNVLDNKWQNIDNSTGYRFE